MKKAYRIYLVTEIDKPYAKQEVIATFTSKGVMWACLNAIRELYAPMIAKGEARIDYDHDSSLA